MIKIVQAPAKRVRTQKSHLQLAPEVSMNPPTIGPSAGPAKGARVKRAKAFPRVPASQLRMLLSNTIPEVMNDRLTCQR